MTPGRTRGGIALRQSLVTTSCTEAAVAARTIQPSNVGMSVHCRIRCRNSSGTAMPRARSIASSASALPSARPSLRPSSISSCPECHHDLPCRFAQRGHHNLFQIVTRHHLADKRHVAQHHHQRLPAPRFLPDAHHQLHPLAQPLHQLPVRARMLEQQQRQLPQLPHRTAP
jgi:hypothetical protein